MKARVNLKQCQANIFLWQSVKPWEKTDPRKGVTNFKKKEKTEQRRKDRKLKTFI